MCTFETDEIYLTWRKGTGFLRHVVGILYKDKDINNNYVFKYSDKEKLKKAQDDGFTYYPAFENIEKIYTNEVREIFSRRLVNPNRKDYDKFLNYWCAEEYKGNNFAILGLTGAKLQTDNFEFIAPHYEIPAIFYTEVTWLQIGNPDIQEKFKNENLSENSNEIILQAEPDNGVDPKAVKVLYEGEKLGYIKSIHCDCIASALNNNCDIKVEVKDKIKNGQLKNVLLKIEINK
ncbi:MAG: HIRAN domain-containing protein [bacterium]